ncbi:MAG: carboxypeptidase regulatory-like domain-containing protein [Terriglobales bacterium]
MTIRRLISLAASMLLLTGLGFGQGVATGDLHVTVKDPGGSLVTNATVVVRDPAKGLERSGSGNGQGEYRVLALPPANYKVAVEAPGFAQLTADNVVITVGQVADLPVALSVAGGNTVVTVSSTAELIETTRTSTTNTVEQRSIDNLPTNGRNYINFALTDSQVSRDNAPATGAAPTSGLNISGQRARSNLVNVDGADAIDNSTNWVRSTVSQEAVQEFQIISNSYAAEYGRAAGGVVNIVTRSGANDFHGDVYGYLRNRDFQAVNPFSTTSNPAYTRVQAGAAFGGPIKKDKTYYYFAYEITRRHETGFSSIGQGNFGLVPFNTAAIAGGAVPLPFGSIQVTPEQAGFLGGLPPAEVGVIGLANLENYVALLGASSGMAVNGAWPTGLVQGLTGGLLSTFSSFPNCPPPGPCFVPGSFQTLASQVGNFPVFEGTSLYSLRLDHNINQNNRVMLRANVSPSTVNGIEVNGQNQVFGQNSFSRTSEQTYRDVTGVAQDSWTIGANKVNEFRFQYARRGLLYNFSDAPGGSNVAVNIPGFAFFGREPYSYIQRVEQRYQFTDNFSWAIGRHNTKFGVDFNYIPITATFTVNYGGEYYFGSVAPPGAGLPSLSPVQAYGAGIPQYFVQGVGNPKDSFSNKPLGVYWQDSWRARPNLTLNYGLRYDIEFPPHFAAPNAFAQAAYNQLGLSKNIQTDTRMLQPRIGLAWDPKGDGKTVFRSSFGVFFDHPLLGLYFLGDASDGSKTGQLLFLGSAPGCSPIAPLSLTATNLFQGQAGNCFPAAVSAFGYEADQQRFNSFLPSSLFLNQGYITNGVPLVSQPFGYPQSKNFLYAYSQQANFTVERDLGGGFALSLAYNWNGGRRINRPINANTARGDLLTSNWQAAVAAGANAPSDSPLAVGTGAVPCGANPIPGARLPFFVPAAMVSFFRPSGLNPSLAGGALAPCVPLALADLAAAGLNTKCNPGASGLTDCVPFSDMDANYSNGSSIYNGFTANLRKKFSRHYQFLASYTWSHAIDDSTDLESPLAPQDSYYPALERSNSTFDQRHRFVFSGVYQSGKLGGDSFADKFFSNWTVAPIIEVASGRPFNILTGASDNFQFDSGGPRPNIVNAGTPTNACGYPTVASKYSPTGFFQEVCFADLSPAQLASPNALLLLDGTLGRNAGFTPWTVFSDLRIARRIYFGERISLDGIVDIFNLANKNNVAAVNPLFTAAGQPTAAYDPRQFQFALKVNW